MGGWVKRYGEDSETYRAGVEQQRDIQRLQRELKCVEEVRHSKKGRRILCQGIWVRYAFIHLSIHEVSDIILE